MSVNPVFPLLILAPILAALLAVSLWQLSISRGSGRSWRWIRRSLMVVALAGLLLNPSSGTTSAKTAAKSLDVLFVVDTTSSSAAEDFDGSKTRLSGMKKDIAALTSEFAGARFAVITFDREATLQLPFTTDTTATNTTADILSQEITLYSAGSSIDAPIALMKEVLRSAKSDEPDRARVVFYMGDGEQTADRSPKSFRSIASLVDGGAVLGYGTERGGKMRERSGFTTDSAEPPYIQDRSGNDFPAPDAISKLDPKTLNQIASQLGVDFHQRERANGIEQIARTIDVKNQASADTDTDTEAVNGLYWAFGIPLGVLAIWELTSLLGLLSATPKPTKQRGAHSA